MAPSGRKSTRSHSKHPAQRSATGHFGYEGIPCDHQGSGSVDQLALSRGTFTLTHSQGTGTPHFNPRTCVFNLALNGTHKLTDGTGAYQGVTGRGIYRVDITEVAAGTASGACSRHGVAGFRQVIKAQGPIGR